MKFYKRNPHRAITGMASLNPEQRGAYNSLIDLLYCQDGVVRDDDREVAHSLSIDLRHWRRLKAELIAAGKVRVQGSYPHSYLQANGVQEIIDEAQFFNSSLRAKAQLRWKRQQYANKINEEKMQEENATNTHIDKKEEAAEKSNEESEPEKPAMPVTKSLEAAIRAKGWK